MEHEKTTPAAHEGAVPGAPPGWMVRSCLWAVLVAIGVCGRLWQPTWNLTPMAGVAIAAGAVFPHPAVAASVPLAALAISNLALPAYGSVAMAVVVFAASAWPVLLGARVGVSGRWSRASCLVAASSALASSLVFFLSTNLAHWWLTSDYPHTVSGLLACFTAALPFYRWMPLGDVVWTGVLFAGLTAVLAGARSPRGAAVA